MSRIRPLDIMDNLGLLLTQTGDVVDLHKLTGFDTGLMSFD